LSHFAVSYGKHGKQRRFRDLSLVLVIVDTLVTSLGSLFQVYAA